ncbi:OmpH family outer membrane protein [Roseomonas sp. HF4]|uniref:OmpH family outer membrane protein n=1 Tax=Roseomonas sp. HF4 TaxID=2562313 RepID=UPI0010BF9E17|nr:OmpH family outer membrane protein [Roseomonas sp. HF4]
MARYLTVALACAFLAFPAAAQQQQQWFVPGQQQQQQRPAQAQQRPAQAPAQQPVQAPPALPQGVPPPAAVIGIVDVPEIQRVSTAFTQVREEIERRRARLNDDLQREQQRWRDEQQRLAAERGGLAPEALRTRERELQDRITDSQRTLRDRAQDIERVAQTSLREIEQALGVIIRQVAASRSVNLVLPRPLVIFNEPPFDLTAEVAAQLNRMLPRVAVPDEVGATPAPAPAPAAPRQGAQRPQQRN